MGRTLVLAVHSLEGNTWMKMKTVSLLLFLVVLVSTLSTAIAYQYYFTSEKKEISVGLILTSEPIPEVPVGLDIDPDTWNLYGKGKWITTYIQLPEEYNAEDIDASTVLLNGTIQPVLDPKYGFVTNSSEYIVDHDGDGILERMMKFNRTEVASWIGDDLGIQYGDITLAITGELVDGTPFEGTGMIRVLLPGDADYDGDVDFYDLTVLAGCYGLSAEHPSYEPLADFDEEGEINFDDLSILAGNYGKTATQ